MDGWGWMDGDGWMYCLPFYLNKIKFKIEIV